jgi:hypothetical protein
VTAQSPTAGDFNFAINATGSDAAQVSRQQLVTLRAVDIEINAAPTGISMVDGSVSQPILLQVVSAGQLNSIVNLSCAGLPLGVSCLFSKTSFRLAGSPQAVTLTLTTTAGISAQTFSLSVVATSSSPAFSRSVAIPVTIASGAASSDLAVAVDHHLSVDPTQLGKPITFTAQLTNNGATAGDVKVFFAFNTPVVIGSSSVECTGTGPVTCDLGTVASSATVNLTVVPRLVRALEASVTVNSSNSESSTANNLGGSSVQVRFRPFARH